jgi:hypothetical protein
MICTSLLIHFVCEPLQSDLEKRQTIGCCHVEQVADHDDEIAAA